MDRYQLAKLVEWAGEIKSRKRMQKIVYLLQSAGCPFDADFILHHYGPYSSEVAQLTDEMTRSDLLREHAVGNVAGGQFNYELGDKTAEQIRKYEATPQGMAAYEAIKPFESRARSLANIEGLRKLELASTVAYFHRQGNSWEDAAEKTGEFKGEAAASAVLRDAVELAKQMSS